LQPWNSSLWTFSEGTTNIQRAAWPSFVSTWQRRRESKVWITRHWESSWSHVSPGCHPLLLHYALPVFTASDKCYPKSYASRASAPSLAAIGSPPICSTHLRPCRLRRINSFEITQNSEQVATASIYYAGSQRSQCSADSECVQAARCGDLSLSLQSLKTPCAQGMEASISSPWARRVSHCRRSSGRPLLLTVYLLWLLAPFGSRSLLWTGGSAGVGCVLGEGIVLWSTLGALCHETNQSRLVFCCCWEKLVNACCPDPLPPFCDFECT
jgi:hypothetical protein